MSIEPSSPFFLLKQIPVSLHFNNEQSIFSIAFTQQRT